MSDVMRSTYRSLSEAEVQWIADVKKMADDLHMKFVGTGDPRMMALAKTKLEEAVMWAVKGVT